MPTKAGEQAAEARPGAARAATQAIESYRFNDAAGAIYRFVWNVFCDWYLELAKPVMMGADGPAKDETRAMVAWARDEILKLLHPFMPFITEELWAVTAARKQLLVLTEWPLRPQTTVVIPTSAIQTGQTGSQVFVVKPDHSVELRQVKIVRTVDDQALIGEGVRGGETVVTDGQLRLVPGSKVEARSLSGATTTSLAKTTP